MKRPTFFLSSTIFDFADLRGAIKHQLEQRGCLVLASEFNDFRKPLDVHSYEACLKSIEQADYFVLLVGTRVGGWYDLAGKVSITQQEYRTAYELQKAGKLKIITLVRDEVWTFRENHKALERHLKTLELEADLAQAITRYPSKFAEDADFIIRFIEEISRNRETKAALSGTGVMPTGNWIHVFKGFGDIADVLNGVLLGGLAVDEAAFRRALRRELIEVLRTGLLKVSGQVFSPSLGVRAFRRDCPLTVEHRDAQVVEITEEVWGPFSTLMMGLLARRFQAPLLDQALSSPTFLAFNPQDGVWRETVVFEALHRLRAEIRDANKRLGNGVFEVIYKHSPKAYGFDRPEELEIDFTSIGMLTRLAFRWANIVDLAGALAAHLDGAPFVMPDLLPWSPLENYDEEIARNEASASEADAYIAGIVRHVRTAQGADTF